MATGIIRRLHSVEIFANITVLKPVKPFTSVGSQCYDCTFLEVRYEMGIVDRLHMAMIRMHYLSIGSICQ